MKIRTLTSAVFALLLVSARAEAQFTAEPSVAPAEDFNVELGIMFWQPTPELTLSTGDTQVGTVDFVQEFGIGDERFREFRVILKPARKHKLRFAYVPFRYDQDAVLQRSITFRNLTFPVTAEANADINWDVYRFGYEWDFVTRRHGFVGVVTELKYNKVKADVSATAQVFGQPVTLSSGFDETAPVPTIGGIARGYLGDHVSITGEFTAFKYDRDEFRGKFYDFDVYGAAHLGKNAGAQIGYRSLTVDFLVNGDAGDMKMKGLYFGGFVRF
jgi:hypothetical protein